MELQTDAVVQCIIALTIIPKHFVRTHGMMGPDEMLGDDKTIDAFHHISMSTMMVPFE